MRPSEYTKFFVERVADAAVRSAEADLERAINVREAGMSTDADVLSIRVHLAAVRALL